MMVDQVSNSKLIEEFLASGGEIRQMPTGASCSRPSSMPRVDRDAFITSRRNYSRAARRNYLTIPQIHEVEAMIERRATRAEIAEYVVRDPDDLFALAETLERSGIAYPQYLREAMETPFEVLRDLVARPPKKPKAKIMRQAHLRTLTQDELHAMERVRAGATAKDAAQPLSIAYETFIKLIGARFGSIAHLKKLESYSEILKRLAVFPIKGAM